MMTKFITKNRVLYFIIFTALLFVDNRADLKGIVHIDFSFNIIAILLLAMMLIYLFTKKTISIDIISIFMLIQLLFYMIQFILSGGYSNNLFYFINLLCCLCVYIYFKNTYTQKKSKTLYNLLIIFGNILSLQVIITRIWLLINQIPNYQIKGFLQIPIGGSNYIASFLLVIFVLLFFVNTDGTKKKIIRYITLASIAISILLTESEGAILALLVFMILILLIKYGKKISNSSFFILNKRKILMFLLFIGLLIISILLYIVSKLSMEQLNTLSSGRIMIYLQYLDAIKNKLLFGWGFYYEQVIGNLAHNWFLSNLLYGGIFGLIIAFMPFCYLLYLSIWKKFSKYSFFATIVYSIVLIHSLFEPNLNTIKFDIFFWMFMGILLNDNQIPQLRITLFRPFRFTKGNAIQFLKVTLLMTIVFVGVGFIQKNIIPVKYISTQTIEVIPHNLTRIDVYSKDETKASIYNQNLLKLVNNDIAKNIQKNYKELSYQYILESLDVNLNSENKFLIKITTSKESLSDDMCSYTTSYIKQKFKEYNKNDKIIVEKMNKSQIHGDNFLFILIFDFIIIIMIVLMAVIYKNNNKFKELRK